MSTPAKRTWASVYHGDYTNASQALSDNFLGVSTLSFSGPFQSLDDDLASKLFKLVKAKTMQTITYCLLPLTAPALNQSWDMSYLSTADIMVFRFVLDLTSSGGGMLFELVGTLLQTTLPTTFTIGMKIRLDTIPNKFLIGVPGLEPSAEALKLVYNFSSAVPPSSISPSKVGPCSSVLRKAAGCVVDDLNEEPYTLRNKTGSAEKMARVGGVLRECGTFRTNRLMSDLSFDVRDFKSNCMRQAARTDLPIGDEMLTFVHLKSVSHLQVWLNDDMFIKCFLGLDDAWDWSVSLANFVKADRCVWGADFDYHGLQTLMEAARNYVSFMTIFKGAVYKDVFDELFLEFNDQDRRLEEYHVDFVWAMLEEVIRNYGYEVRHTHGKVARNYGIGQPIATPTDCSLFFKHLLHAKLEALRGGKWPAAPHTVYRSKVLTLVRNRPVHAAFIDSKAPTITTSAVPSETLAYPHDLQGKVPVIHTRAVHHQLGTCFWDMAGALGLMSKSTNRLYQCHDPNVAVHKPLSEILHEDALRLLDDKDFLSSCGSSLVHKRVKQAAMEQADKFAN